MSKVDVKAVAYLWAELNYSQDEIAEVLGASQSAISRALKQAENDGILKREVRLVPEEISEGEIGEILKQVSHHDVERHLKKAEPSLFGTIRGIRIVSSISRQADASAWDLRLQDFGRSAAAQVLSLLRAGGRIGVSWGSTVAAVVQGIASLRGAPRTSKQPIQFIPLCGEPLGRALAKTSASELAAKLDQCVNGGRANSLSLAAVPALIPMDKDFTSDEVVVVKKLFRRVDGYRSVMGVEGGKVRTAGRPRQGRQQDPTRPALIDQLDGVLVSVSLKNHPWGSLDNQLLSSAGITDAMLSGVSGDIGGAILEKEDASAAERENFERLRDRWTGIQLEHIQALALSRERTPGVIVVAIGLNKADMLCECLRRRLVNYLIIDEDLAGEIERLTASPHPAK